MPREADAKEEARQELLLTPVLAQLEEDLLDPSAPLIEGAKVVYMGAKRNRTVCLPGKLMVEEYETGETDKAGKVKLDKDGEPLKRVRKTVLEGSDAGHTNYDFSTHDIFGRVITAQLMGDEYGQEVARRRGHAVEHAGHLYTFFRLKGPDQAAEFRVLVPPEKKGVLQEYIARVDRKRGATEKLFRDTGGVVREERGAVA